MKIYRAREIRHGSEHSHIQFSVLIYSWNNDIIAIVISGLIVSCSRLTVSCPQCVVVVQFAPVFASPTTTMETAYHYLDAYHYILRIYHSTHNTIPAKNAFL